MRDLVSKPKIVGPAAGDASVDHNSSGSGQVENEKRKLLSFVNDDICGTMLDVCFQRLIKREKVLPGTSFSLGTLELWSDDFEGKGEFSQYRSRLVSFTWLCFMLIIMLAVKSPSSGGKGCITCRLEHSNVQKSAL